MEVKNIREQIDELREIEHERKLLMQQEMRDSVKQIQDERNVLKVLQKEHDRKFGFNSFPYTHGEAIEHAQANLRKQQKVEMQVEMERRKNIIEQASTTQDHQELDDVEVKMPEVMTTEKLLELQL